MTADQIIRIKKLHQLYVDLTGLRLSLDSAREHTWWDWLQRGLTEDDLRRVVRMIRAGIKDGSRNPGALKFHNLIGQPDYFEEDAAQAAYRSHASHPSHSQDRPPKSVGLIAREITQDPAAAAAALAELKKLKSSL